MAQLLKTEPATPTVATAPGQDSIAHFVLLVNTRRQKEKRHTNITVRFFKTFRQNICLAPLLTSVRFLYTQLCCKFLEAKLRHL